MSHRSKRQRVSSNTVNAEADTSDAPFDNQTSREIQGGEQQSRSLFVTSLAPETTSDDLTEHFSQSYPVKHATAVLDTHTKTCRGYGFITFADPEDAVLARNEYDGSTLHGRLIKVDIAKPRLRNGEPGAREKGQDSSDAVNGLKDGAGHPVLPSKLIIRNLPWSIAKPEQLSALFESYGKVNQAILPQKRPGILAGFGIVLLKGRKNAEKALEEVNGKTIDGRTVAVDWAVDRETWQSRKNASQSEDSKNDVEQDEKSSEHSGSSSSSGSDSISSQTDDESDLGEEKDDAIEEPEEHDKFDDYSKLLFIRNLPFTTTDDTLFEHFSEFGAVRYARIVVDRANERPKGTGFVCFYNSKDLDDCLREAPKSNSQKASDEAKVETAGSRITRSILQNEESDPSGRYTMDGRVLQITRAVERSEANRLTAEGVANRFARDKDKRRLYLLSEGTIPVDAPLYKKLSPSEVTMREASAKQRKTLIESNPSLHLSLTRLSVRNIPRTISSKELKELARKAIVGFATDVKEGRRQRLSREELERGGEEMREAERERKKKAKGVVKQAKIVFESREGGKVDESTGAGRSRGYGFIEFYTHRNALMGLRWLNGHAIDYKVNNPDSKKPTKMDMQERKKRLIVEFAIENAQVVKRRNDREHAPRDKTEAPNKREGREPKKDGRDKGKLSKKADSKKRKRGQGTNDAEEPKANKPTLTSKTAVPSKEQTIIARKRMLRRKKARQS